MSANVIIQFRRGTASEWTSADPTLANGEVGLETDTSKIKIGDGTTAWTSLSYLAVTTPADFGELADVDMATLAPSSGDVAYFDGTNWVPYPLSLSNASDVSIAGAATGEVLTYDGTEWVPASTDPIRIPLSEANGGFVTGTTVHTTPAGYTDTLYLYASGTGNVLATSSGTDTFNPNSDGVVYSIAVQSDDKIVFGGYFATVGGVTRTRLARVHPNGDVDTTFVDPILNNGVRSLAIQSDGNIVFGGDFTSAGGSTRNRVARVHANAALDTTFADPNANSTVWSVAVQSDGKIVLGGNFTSVGGVTRNYLARVHANGALDTTFNPNLNSTVRSVAIQSDGKIVFAGNFYEIGGVTRKFVARVHANGALDTTFDPNSSSSCESVAIQSDGKILIGGNFFQIGGVNREKIARVHANGAVDTTFDPNPTAGSVVTSLAEQSDGKVLFGGSFTTVGGVTRNKVARVHANGDLDTTFNPNPNNTVSAIALQSDDKILLGGFFTYVHGSPRNRIARVDGVFGDFNDIKSEVYVSPGANSMDLIISDYPVPAGYSVVSGIAGTLTGYVTREAN